MNTLQRKESSSQLDVKGGKLFPYHFQIVAVILTIPAVAFFPDHPLIAIGFLLVSALILTATSGEEFNQPTGTYREYRSFLFIKTGKSHSYEGVEKIFINAGNVSQRMYTVHTNSSAVFTNMEYRGYVKLINGIKIFLGSGKNKEQLEVRLKALSSYLQSPLVDHTLQ